MDAFGIKPKKGEDENLRKVFSRLGFFRNWHTYSLLHGRELKAVFIVNQSDLGINLSELLNSITVIVVDPVGLSWEILSAAIMNFTGGYKMDNIPS